MRLRSIKVPRKLILKVSVFLLIFYTILIATQAFSKPSIQQYKLRIERSIKFKFRAWYSNFLSSSYHLESNEYFSNKLREIKKEKLKNDPSNDLWDIDDEKIGNLSLEIDIPSYYYNKKREKPIIQAFDPRFTIGIYLNHIRFNPRDSVPFHWSDWIDMSKLIKYLLSSEKAKCRQLFDISNNDELVGNSNITPFKEYCDNNKDFPLGFKIIQFPGAQTVENNEILAKSYLYSSAPSPVKLIFLTDSKGSYEVDVSKYQENDLKNSLLSNGIVENLITKKQIGKKLNVLNNYKGLVVSSPSGNQHELLEDFQISIERDLFSVDPHDIRKRLEIDENKLNLVEKNYLNSIQYSIEESDPPKYFLETKLLDTFPQKWLGDHYDWRFFDGLMVGNEKQVISLHRLLKNYVNFARQHGLITWIAHGSLLSWYWDGISFPWDTDIDAQMPIQELHTMSKRFNQSLIIESVGNKDFEFDGMGKYFLDVGSSITHRNKGNGKNTIDARFIDIDTGLYIDITGLALSDSPAPSRYDYLNEMDETKKRIVSQSTNGNGELNHRIKNEQLQVYNCRNNHFSTYDELSPLILTVFENQLSYIPSNFIITLNSEYGIKGLTERIFKDYAYLKNFRIWIKTQIVLDYLSDPERFISENNSTLNNINSDKSRAEKIKRDSSINKIVDLEKLKINKLTVSDHINLLQNNIIFKEYIRTFPFTKFHEQELEHLMKNNYNKMKDMLSTYKNKNNFGKALRPDLFAYKLIKDDWNFNEEVDKIVKLSAAYKSMKEEASDS